MHGPLFEVIRGRMVVAGVCAALACASIALAEDPLPSIERLKTSPVLRDLKVNPITGAPKTDAERTIAQMHLPEGFKVEVIAAEPDVQQPIAFAWDERGRIWIAEAYSYPQKRPPGEGLDRIIILSDEDGDGRFETRKVFAEKLNLVSAIEVGHGGVWIGAAPELLFIPDLNHDDKPDGAPEVMLDGFGYQDTHETLNSFLWGPDGWLYGIQGVFNTARIGKPGVPPSERPELRAGVWRYHPMRRTFEIYAHGGSNPWGLDYDEHGQFFMTHCRSFWGRGLTTHVIQGGQFWNQVNANYAPFIIANPPKEFPEFRNYLLASARYDHGAGGAGARGSDAIYGGHSHVGTMIYLGDNWPDEYRGHLFTHNLGGHQINHQINQPLGSGFNTVHAGRDVLFCTDPKYVAVDLQYGPDGAVYFIDWYDQQHCHNPNTERWDRGNGRVYRMQWQATYKSVKVDLAVKSDLELVELQSHKSQWFARTARRLLHERAQTKDGIARAAVDKLRDTVAKSPDATLRLNTLWALNLAGGLNAVAADAALNDPNPFVRGWTIQLAASDALDAEHLADRFVSLARNDPSPVVRRYLASVAPRLPGAFPWQIFDSLARREEDKDDHNLPYLIWHSMATLWSQFHPQRNGMAYTQRDTTRALAIADATKMPALADWIYWYAATRDDRPLASLKNLDGDALHRRLAAVCLALESRGEIWSDRTWKTVAPRLYESPRPEIQRLAERIAPTFGDRTAFPRLRTALADTNADLVLRQHAFAVLSRARDNASFRIFLALLDEKAFRTETIRLLPSFGSRQLAPALIDRFNTFPTADKSAALEALTSRSLFARALLDAVATGKIPRDQLTSFHVTRLTSLRDTEVDKRVAATWGRIQKSSAEKQAQIAKLEKVFNEAPLWAYNAAAGRQHFQKLCVQCHRIGSEGTRLGPELTGAGKHGARYFLENIIDPDAVIGTDFQATTVETKDGESITGLLANETPAAVTLRTTTGESVVPKSTIKAKTTGAKSLMPEALLDSLSEREQIELLKFLTTN
jgi:putative membrane-bound dehydrogenase-like protein